MCSVTKTAVAEDRNDGRSSSDTSNSLRQASVTLKFPKTEKIELKKKPLAVECFLAKIRRLWTTDERKPARDL